jgi:hypothetical protein
VAGGDVVTFASELCEAMAKVADLVTHDLRMGRMSRDAAAGVLLEEDAGDAESVIAVAQAMVPLILALEEAEEVAKDNAGKARAALCAALEATTGRVRAGIHTATTSAGRASVAITDDTAIPAEYMRQPPPQPDKAAILAALKAGEDVPGVLLRNGPPVLRITTAKEAAS